MRAPANAIAISGWSGSGKTTAVAEVVRRLVGRGLSVAVVKSDRHGVRIDPDGTDSATLFAAGARVLLVGPDGVLERRRADQRSLVDVVAVLARDHDLVLVEGAKRSAIPKVWLCGPGGEAPPAEATGVIAVLAREADRAARIEEIALARLAAAWAARPVLGGVLVGGASSRMGRPKEELARAGRTFQQIVRDALAPHVDRVLLLGGAGGDQDRIPDAPGVGGPLAGLLAAMRWAPEAAWIVCPCDLPLLEPAAVSWLKSRRAPGRWAILPEAPSGVEPLFAVFEPPVRSWLEEGARIGAGPRCVLDRPHVARPEIPSELARCWTNVNTPEELSALPEP